MHHTYGLTPGAMSHIRISTPLYSLALVTTITIAACTPADTPPETQTEGLTKSVGWLHGNCLAIKNANLAIGTNVKVIDPDAPNSSNSAKISAVASKADECHALLDDRKTINKEQGNYFYVVVPVKPVNMAFGIVFTNDEMKSSTGQVDLNIDGVSDTFYYCNTSEGVDFSIWQGKPYKSDKLWGEYYYLGYDMKPDCPQEK